MMKYGGIVDMDVTRDEQRTIMQIVDRADRDGLLEHLGGTRMDLDMDLCAIHRDSPLRLTELLAADVSNFGHDICGIRRYIDRATGTLTNCFLPRYTAPRKAAK